MVATILSASGNTTCVIGTEVTAYNPTTFKRFDGYVDLSPMVTGDTIEIRVYVLLDALGSYVLYNVQPLSGVQATPLIYIPMLPTDLGWKLTLKQTATTTTAKVIPWRIYEI